MKLEIKVLELSHDDIVTILADCHISYWCQYMGLGKELYSKYRRDDDCREDVQSRALLNGEKMTLIDIEDDNEKWYLTYEKLVKGVEKWICSGYGSSSDFGGKFDGMQDCYDMDMIIQFALFDDVVFG